MDDSSKQHVKEIKKKIESDLWIKRVPQKHLRWFREYARKEFADDYGMLLRELICFYRGMYSETMMVGIDAINEKLDKLIEPPQEQTKEYVTMADGRRIEK